MTKPDRTDGLVPSPHSKLRGKNDDGLTPYESKAESNLARTLSSLRSSLEKGRMLVDLGKSGLTKTGLFETPQ